MNNAITAKFNTGEYHGYNISFSPYNPDLLACASSQNYGITGRGRAYVLSIHDNLIVNVLATKDYKEGLFDVTWSEASPNLLVTSSGDGTIQMWDYTKDQMSIPVAYYKIHSKEVYSVDWNPRNVFSYILSASWDKTVKVWNPYVMKEVAVYAEHTDQVYQACWNKRVPELCASVSADQTLRLWDLRNPRGSTGSYAHESEVLCCDWSRTDPDIIATGTTEGRIVEWDIRKMLTPLFILSGHEYAIRQLKFSPFERGRLASVSYDFTTRFWNWNVSHALQIHKEHTEFVYGLDYNPLKPKQACDCAWDSLLFFYNETE